MRGRSIRPMRLHGLVAGAMLAGLAIAQDPRGDLRASILRVAEQYATFEWRAAAANVLHGDDADGVRVDTPDQGFDPAGFRADGTVNRGMPYAWGGFASIEQFQAGIAAGRFAGLVPTSERAGASRFAVGVDCSGYVSRCFDLPVKQTTRSLATLCRPLEGFGELEPGDLLNRHDSHVVLFAAWVDAAKTRMRVFEAARLRVQESVYDTAALRRDGFRPLRYLLLDPRWREMDRAALGAPAWQRGAATGPSDFTAAGAAARGADAQPLRAAEIGTWTAHTVAEDGREFATRTWLAAAAAGRDLDLQCLETIDGKSVPTARRVPRGQDAAPALVDLLAFHEPIEIERTVSHAAESGTCTHAGRTFAARRHRWQLEGSTVVRHQRYPIWLDATVVIADGVPLHGVVTAQFDLAVDWHLTGDRRGASRHRVELALDAFGSCP